MSVVPKTPNSIRVAAGSSSQVLGTTATFFSVPQTTSVPELGTDLGLGVLVTLRSPPPNAARPQPWTSFVFAGTAWANFWRLACRVGSAPKAGTAVMGRRYWQSQSPCAVAPLLIFLAAASACGQGESADEAAAQASSDSAADQALGDAAANPGVQGKTTKLDVLFVVGANPSMERTQRRLALASDAFIKALHTSMALASEGKLDVQAAAISSQQLPRRFNGQWLLPGQPQMGQNYPGPGGQEAYFKPCKKDEDCAIPGCEPLPSDFSIHSPMCQQASGGCIPYPALPGGNWMCIAKTSPALTGTCSVVTTCVRTCNSDQDCSKSGSAVWGQGTDFCSKAYTFSKCLPSPATEGCPTTQVSMMAGDKLSNLRCALTVGMGVGTFGDREGGLSAALAALEATSHTCKACASLGCTCLAKDLLRADAHLLVVIVTNEEDCSMSPALDAALGQFASDPEKMKAEFYKMWPAADFNLCRVTDDPTSLNHALAAGYCNWQKWQDKKAGKAPQACPEDCAAPGLTAAQVVECEVKSAKTMQAVRAQFGLQSTDPKLADWRLADPTVMAARLAALKPGSDGATKVMLAAIVGASTASTSQGKYLDAAAYYGHMLVDAYTAASLRTYLCESPDGKVLLGSRYAAATAALGKNGFLQNLCAPSGLGPALANIAAWSVERIQAGK